MTILGIETSCDETAIAIVQNGKKIIASVIYSQVKEHEKWGGIVPEIASRKHLEIINQIIDDTFKKTNLKYNDIDAVAVVCKPGLVGSLLVGLQTAKAFSFSLDVPLIPVNHIEAHLYAPHLEYNIPFPNLGIVISGGHSLIFLSHSHTKHTLLGSTIDDAIGESFDKIAKHFELGYPGGPIIDKIAKQGDKYAYSFPIPKFKYSNDKQKNKYKLSYSGLKSAVIHQNQQFKQKPQTTFLLQDLLASFQKTAFDILIDNINKALQEYKYIQNIVITGGVACNSYIRNFFLEKNNENYDKNYNEKNIFFPAPILSTDNGAMVAGLGYHLYKENIIADFSLEALPKIIKKI